MEWYGVEAEEWVMLGLVGVGAAAGLYSALQEGDFLLGMASAAAIVMSALAVQRGKRLNEVID